MISLLFNLSFWYVCLSQFPTTDRNQHQAQVAYLDQQAVQGCLIHHRAGQGRGAVWLVDEGHIVEPLGPFWAQVAFDSNLIAYGWHVYTCGPDRFMDSVMEAAERQGFPEEARHLEYFSVP